ncbi:hypothetical protein [Desulfovirgula thermocuniculi]|uniref:hypothetical protein n=1 Tax=Desulfovirgula thermocuniculi TaxID=348842 RepID=UPI000422D411|nr:hypothetical protein [Desulfovirgula thermocuniculi]
MGSVVRLANGWDGVDPRLAHALGEFFPGGEPGVLRGPYLPMPDKLTLHWHDGGVRVECPACVGLGYLPCPACGESPEGCPECDEGYADCPACGGQGTLTWERAGEVLRAVAWLHHQRRRGA